MESVWEALKQDNRSGGDRGESCFMCPNDTHCLAVPTTRSQWRFSSWNFYHHHHHKTGPQVPDSFYFSVYYDGFFRITFLKCYFLILPFVYLGFKHFILQPTPSIIWSHPEHLKTSFVVCPQVHLPHLPCVSHGIFPNTSQLVLLANFLGSPMYSVFITACLMPGGSFLLCLPITLCLSFKGQLRSQF